MARNRRKHGKRKPGNPNPVTTPSTIITSETRDTNANTPDHTVMAPTSNPHSSDSNAARKFFHTIELLALTLEYLPIRNLSRVLSVSKHFRQVIFGSPKLRQELFLGSSQRKEYLRTKRISDSAADLHANIVFPNRCRFHHEVIVPELDEDNQHDRIIVEAHPVPVPERASLPSHVIQLHYRIPRCLLDYRSPPLGCKSDFPFLKTGEIFCEAMERVPAEAFPFQPPATKVNMYHHRHRMSLERTEGVTFGMVADELRKIHAEDTQHVEKLIKSVIKLPCTRANREAYADAKELLDGSRGENMCTWLREPCLHFEAEGAVSRYSTTVWRATQGPDTAGLL